MRSKRARRDILVGHFDIGTGTPVLGQLTLAGRDTHLRLFGETLPEYAVPDVITGVLNDQTHLTLLRCTLIRARRGQQDGRVHSELEVFPHFVLVGSEHLPAEAAIRRSVLVLDDAASLFYDFDAFSTVLDPAPIMAAIASHQSQAIRRPVPVGPHPHVAYFGGRSDIAEVPTQYGVFRAHHSPSFTLGGPRGVSIKNTISLELEFADAVSFDECFEKTLRILQFLELLLGRQQMIRQHHIQIELRADRVSLRNHWSHAPRRDLGRHDDRRGPHPADVLMDAIRDPTQFAAVLAQWVASDSLRRTARQRFHGCFVRGNRFSTERLVAAANVFDILPESAVPGAVSLSNELNEAKALAQTQFGNLERSYERDSILSALGRLGRPSLKHKARFRAETVLLAAPGRFPRLLEVLDEAVNCRNFFVHGTATRIDYGEEQDAMPFLARTLEFVFGASDLIECGWNIAEFLSQGTTGSHPFGNYKAYYSNELAEFARLLP